MKYLRRLFTWTRLCYLDICIHDLEVAHFSARNAHEKKELGGKIEQLEKKRETALDKYFACRT